MYRDSHASISKDKTKASEESMFRHQMNLNHRQDDLFFFRNSMLKRFSKKTREEVEAAIMEALAAMAPSVNRLRLGREVKSRLSSVAE